jgi:hypothetical protein
MLQGKINKKILIINVLMFFTFCVLVAEPTDEQVWQAANTFGVPYADLRQFVQSYQNNTSSTDVMVVDAVTLHQAYQSNRVRADNRYKGKTLKITGIVYEVETDHVKLQGRGIDIGCDIFLFFWIFFGGRGYVYFKSTELPKVANMDVGQTVTFIGIGDSVGGYVETIKDAVAVN